LVDPAPTFSGDDRRGRWDRQAVVPVRTRGRAEPDLAADPWPALRSVGVAGSGLAASSSQRVSNVSHGWRVGRPRRDARAASPSSGTKNLHRAKRPSRCGFDQEPARRPDGGEAKHFTYTFHETATRDFDTAHRLPEPRANAHCGQAW